MILVCLVTMLITVCKTQDWTNGIYRDSTRSQWIFISAPFNTEIISREVINGI